MPSLADPFKFTVELFALHETPGTMDESAGSSSKQPHPKAAVGMRHPPVISPEPQATPGAQRMWLHGLLVMVNPGPFSST